MTLEKIIEFIREANFSSSTTLNTEDDIFNEFCTGYHCRGHLSCGDIRYRLVINSKVKPLNMRTYRLFNIVVPVILFLIVLFVAG